MDPVDELGGSSGLLYNLRHFLDAVCLGVSRNVHLKDFAKRQLQAPE
jgi:hypothetical protein